MDIQDNINRYKIKNIQKTNQNGEGFLSVLKLWNESLNEGSNDSSNEENIAKVKVLPKRYMTDVNAQFSSRDIAAEEPPAEEMQESDKIETIAESEKAKKIKEKKPKIKKVKENKAITETIQEVNIFYDSLSDMTPNDITLNEVAKTVKKPSVDIVRYFALLLSLAIFVFAGYNIVDQLNSYVKAARDKEALRAIFYGNEESQLEAEFLRKTKINVPIQDILSLQKQTGERIIEAEVSDGVKYVDKDRNELHKLTNINSDFFCWIKVSLTSIDYPVAQTSDNDYYLYNNFYKKPSSSGTIFCDYRNNKNIAENRHVILYGHNMLDNSIFEPLINFGVREELFRDSIIELITEDAMYYYEVFSVNEEDPYSGYIKTNFATDEEYVEFLYMMKERSIFQKNVVLDADSKIITLSTCVNNYRIDRRFVVRGVLIDVK